MGRNALFHGGLDVLPVELTHDEVLIADLDVDKQVEDSNFELVRCLGIVKYAQICRGIE